TLVTDTLRTFMGLLGLRVIVSTGGTTGFHFAILDGSGTVTLLVQVETVLAGGDPTDRDFEGRPFVVFGDGHGADFFANAGIRHFVDLEDQLLRHRDTRRNSQDRGRGTEHLDKCLHEILQKTRFIHLALDAATHRAQPFTQPPMPATVPYSGT